MCATHGRSRLVCCRFFRRVTSFSSALPSDSPHQRIVCETRNYLIGRGPLMCPWAFATQSESHRRPHTDNRAARHGFWKVTLRIAKNGSARCRMRTQANGQRNMHGFRDALTHTAATDIQRTHSCTAKRPSIGRLTAGEMTVVGGLDGFTSLCLKGKSFLPIKQCLIKHIDSANVPQRWQTAAKRPKI